MQITISSKDMERIRRGFAESPQVIGRELNKYLLNTAIDMQRDSAKEAPVDTGTLQSVIRLSRSNLRYRVYPESDYAVYAHDGRKPGKQPPVEAVESWARRKGIDPFLVARAIGRKGTKGKPFLEIAFNKNKMKAEREGRATLNRIVRMI